MFYKMVEKVSLVAVQSLKMNGVLPNLYGICGPYSPGQAHRLRQKTGFPPFCLQKITTCSFENNQIRVGRQRS